MVKTAFDHNLTTTQNATYGIKQISIFNGAVGTKEAAE